MNGQENRDQLAKQKVWVVFGISVVITACICFVSYMSFFSLGKSIDRLGLPDIRVELINDIFQDIVEAENYIQSYILSGDLQLESDYLEHTNDAHIKIQELKKLVQGDPAQIARVDSLESLFLTKMTNLQDFLKIKERRKQSVFSGEALKKITNTISDSTKQERQLLKREFVKGDYVPTTKEKVVITPDDHKGIKGFFRKMLGVDKPRIDTIRTVEEELLLSKEIRVDTSVMTNTQPDSTLMEVKTILKGVMKKERKIQKQISDQELFLLLQDRKFIAEMRSIIKELRKQANADLSASHRYASETAERTTRFIIGAGLVGLLMSGFFLFLILKDMAGAYFYRIQLEREKVQTEKLAKAKEEFMSNMSHEIRTPLQSIQGFTELIAQTALNDQQTHFLSAIKYSNNYLSQLINDVLDEAKMEAGMLQLSSQSFDLKSMLDELWMLHEEAAQQKRIEFKMQFFGDDLSRLTLVGDDVRLRQILVNLLSNAIKFTDEGEVVLAVSSTIADTKVALTIEVHDTGCGIAEELQPIIFDPFTQELHHGREKNYKGTGLGLSISKKLTEAMGGTIGLRTKKEVGSTFTVNLTLPIERNNGAERDTSPEKVKTDFKKIDACVMVVEDDGWNAILLKEILLKAVTRVKIFQDANVALAYLEQSEHAVNLIFTDIQMPEMTGDQFLVAIRDKGFSMPVVALTAHVQAQKLSELKAKGFDGVFSKPYKTADIHQLLAQHLDSRGISKVVDEIDSAQEEISVVQPGMIDLSMIRKFAGGDEESFHTLMATLVESNARQIMEFDSYLKAAQVKLLADLSHQMKTTYDNLGVYMIAEALASVELHQQMGNDQRAFECAHEVQPELQVVFDQLRTQIKPQSHI